MMQKSKHAPLLGIIKACSTTNFPLINYKMKPINTLHDILAAIIKTCRRHDIFLGEANKKQQII